MPSDEKFKRIAIETISDIRNVPNYLGNTPITEEELLERDTEAVKQFTKSKLFNTWGKMQ